MRSTLRVYLRYAFIGAIVGIASVLGRELLALLLPSDDAFYYALSVVIVYSIGIVVSYFGHRKVTFGHVDMAGHSVAGSMANFTAIQLFGLVCTTVLALVVREYFGLQEYLGPFTDAFAFAFAVVTTSVISFFLNARFTFTERPEAP